jgi:hypothetical protein
MSQQRIAIGPAFYENQPQRILAIDVNRMGQAARLATRAMDMFETEPKDFV